MATIAEFSIPTEEFALKETLERCPDLTFEVDRVAAHDPAHVMPFVWVAGEELDDLSAILEDDPSVERIELLTELDDERFYQLEWADEARVVGYMIIECSATVQRAIAAEGEWTLRVLFPEHRGVSMTADFAQEHGLSLNLRRIYGLDDADRVRYDLTQDQQDTLIEAYEHGYYDIPRTIDSTELASLLDISHQALSERFRRATRSLIENTLIVGEDESQ